MSDLVVTTGPRLKAERERRGLSSQKAADELHLDGWIIDALEAEDYERIGPSVYAKGHLKRYAALLGLPSAEIVAGYDSRAQAPKPLASQPANMRLRTDDPVASNLPWPPILGAIGAVLLVLGVWWWKPWHQRGAAENSAPLAANPSAAASDAATNTAATADTPAAASPSPSSSAPASALPPPASSSAPGAAAALPAMQQAPLTTPTTSSGADVPAGAGRAHLRLSFSADSWVEVHDAAGRRVFAGNGRANSVKSIDGLGPMRVYLGFASGVQLEINNRAVAIGPQFVSGDVARFEAGADGVLRRDSRGAAAPGTQPRGARPAG
ncbi:MAG TPA: RodZ domain-containing protein [Steroidobacteraceae bacterium]|nr:RodZ domain-containing protein [Steroidobacteraceae bacterium]